MPTMGAQTDLTLAEFMRSLDLLPICAVLVDREGRLLAGNAKFLGRSGLPAEALPSCALDQFCRFVAPGETRSGMAEISMCGAEPVQVQIACKSVELRGETDSLDLLTFADISQTAREMQSVRDQYREVSRLSDVVLEQALELKRYSSSLEDLIRERTAELQTANMDAIYMLAVACEAKDTDTGAHVRRIETYAEAMVEALNMPASIAKRVGYSAILHDVGKMQIPDDILKKPGRLTPDERRVMENHTLIGERILANTPFFEIARKIARSHHENWDGSGYPDGLAGKDIPLSARIVHMVDVFDALTSRRPYKEPWPVEKALANLHDGAGKQFDPDLLKVFTTLHEQGSFDEIIPK